MTEDEQKQLGRIDSAIDACGGLSAFYQRANARYAYSQQLGEAAPVPETVRAEAFGYCLLQIQMLHEWQVSMGHFGLARVTRGVVDGLLVKMRLALDAAQLEATEETP